jgi:hypothetical protein
MLHGLLGQVIASAAHFFKQRMQFLFPRGISVLEICEPAVDLIRWNRVVMNRDVLSGQRQRWKQRPNGYPQRSHYNASLA